MVRQTSTVGMEKNDEGANAEKRINAEERTDTEESAKSAGQEKGLCIKRREAFYCNVKLLLIFMVVYGHMIEGLIDTVEPLMQIYRVIYSVHMPMFLFLSGLFLKNRTSCLRQGRQMLLYYGVCQAVAVSLARIVGRQWNYGTPVWHLWYLLSLACMAGVGWCWYAVSERWQRLNNGGVKAAILVFTVLTACMAGGWSAVGRWFSLSRTICFLPYFMAGMFCPTRTNWRSRSFKIAGLAGLTVYILLYLGLGNVIPTALFYQADSYAMLGIEQGAILRMVCMIMALSLGLGVLALIPDRRFPFSKMGADTMWIYLLHAPMVKLPELVGLLAQTELPQHIWMALSPFLAIYIIFFLYKLFLWRRPLYSLPA